MTINELYDAIRELDLPGEFTIHTNGIDWDWEISCTTEDIKADQEVLTDNRLHVQNAIEQSFGHYIDLIDIWQNNDSCGFGIILKDFSEFCAAAISKLQNTPHPGLFEINNTRIKWCYIASYVDARRVEDLHSTQNEAMMYVINTIGAGAFRLHGVGNSNDRCWFEIEVV